MNFVWNWHITWNIRLLIHIIEKADYGSGSYLLRSDKDVICRRIWKVTEGKETLKLRFILDRQSIELFVNDGEQVVTTAICTPMEADEIVFSCDGKRK